MAAKSIEKFQTSTQTMNEEFGPAPETLGDDSLPQPIQGNNMSVKEYYDQFCIWISKLEAVNSVHYVDADEWYVVDFFFGLKMDLMERVFQHKGIRRVSDAFRWAEMEENSWKNHADVVFDGMSNPESKHFDELQADEICDDKSDDLEVQIEVDAGKGVSPMADHKVFDELSQPTFTARTSYTMIATGLNVDRGLNFLGKTTSNHILGNSDDALSMLNKSTGLVTGLNLSSKESTIENVDGLFSAKQKEMQTAHILVDETPMLFPTMLFEKIDGDKCSIPLMDCALQVFDPGTSASLCIHNRLFQPSVVRTTGLKSVSGQCQSFATFLGQCKAVQFFIFNDMVLLSDQGGCAYHSTSFGNKAVHFTSQDMKGMKHLDRDRGYILEARVAHLGIEDPPRHLIEQRNEADDVSAISWLKMRFSDMSRHSNVELFLRNVLLLFDPGGRFSELSILLSLSQLFDIRHKPYSLQPMSLGHCLFDVMTDLYTIKQNDKINNRKVVVLEVTEFPILLGCIVDVSRTSKLIFDPGGHLVCYMGCSSLMPIGKKNCALCDFWAADLTSAAFQLCVPDPCSRVSSLHQTGYATRHSLEPRKINGNAIMTVFDPGGILVCYNGCDPFVEHRKNDMKWSFHSISRNDGAEIWCFWGYFQHCVGAYLLHLSTVLMINMSMIEFSYNHCCWTIYKIYEHYLEPRQELVGNFRIGMLAGSCHFPEGRFPGGYKNVVLLMAIILESFVWDPGLSAIFFSLSHVQLVLFL